MGAVHITLSDLSPFADIADDKALAMIEDALARAARVAPCITSTDFAYENAARAIIRGAILRWNEAGTGALSQRSESTGPYAHSESVDTRQQRKMLFWPSEITELQELCRNDSDDSGAFSVDTVGCSTLFHTDICSVNFGGACSCGAILTGSYPLYGV